MYRLPNILRTFGFLALLVMWIPFCLMFFSLPAGQINFEDPETIIRSLFSSGALFSGFGLLTLGMFAASIALQLAASASFHWMRQRAKTRGEAVTANIVKADSPNTMNNSTYRHVTFDLKINYKGETVATRMKELLHRERASYFRVTAKTVNVKFDPQTKMAVLNE
ncbi:MAG TPA: hypothetical protein PLA27_02175 [Anaerolineales bacterium]|nr:hypothetical protein [Anaerolineales bacterium]